MSMSTTYKCIVRCLVLIISNQIPFKRSIVNEFCNLYFFSQQTLKPRCQDLTGYKRNYYCIFHVFIQLINFICIYQKSI